MAIQDFFMKVTFILALFGAFLIAVGTDSVTTGFGVYFAIASIQISIEEL